MRTVRISPEVEYLGASEEEATTTRSPTPSSDSGSWLTPGRLLVLFCTLNAFIYMDRGVISSNGVSGQGGSPGEPGSGIMGAFGLTLFQMGLLPAAFMVGLLAASPLFAEAAKRWPALRLIALGLGIWTAAVVLAGLSWSFWPLLAARMVVGVGEASFVALASPFIDDFAPPERKSSWLAAFYLCIPAGIAGGYIFGGLVAGALGWRAPFLLEALLALPLIALLAGMPPLRLRGTSPHELHEEDGEARHAATPEEAYARTKYSPRRRQFDASDDEGDLGPHIGAPPDPAPVPLTLFRSLERDVTTLTRLPVYLLVVAGMTCYTALLGALAYYGPRAGRELFDIPAQRADVAFGGVTVVTGVLGTLAGGAALDALGSSVRHALGLCAAGLAAGALLFLTAVGLAHSFGVFMTVLALAEFCMFATMAPSNAVILWTVPPALRAPAMSMSVVVMHVLGDVPSPPLLGLLQGRLRDWRLSLAIATSLLAAGAAAYALALGPARRAVDYREGAGLRIEAQTAPSIEDLGGAEGVVGVEGVRLRLLAGQSTPNLRFLEEEASGLL